MLAPGGAAGSAQRTALQPCCPRPPHLLQTSPSRRRSCRSASASGVAAVLRRTRMARWSWRSLKRRRSCGWAGWQACLRVRRTGTGWHALVGSAPGRCCGGGGPGAAAQLLLACCFLPRSLPQDMSDDEKPLGWRAEAEAKKQKRAPAAAAAPKQGAGAAKKAATPKKAAPAAAAAAAAAPAGRRRREAAAGVAAAVHAVAAVQAAVAEDGACGRRAPACPCCSCLHAASRPAKFLHSEALPSCPPPVGRRLL